MVVHFAYSMYAGRNLWYTTCVVVVYFSVISDIKCGLSLFSYQLDMYRIVADSIVDSVLQKIS